MAILFEKGGEKMKKLRKLTNTVPITSLMELMGNCGTCMTCGCDCGTTGAYRNGFVAQGYYEANYRTYYGT